MKTEICRFIDNRIISIILQSCEALSWRSTIHTHAHTRARREEEKVCSELPRMTCPTKPAPHDPNNPQKLPEIRAHAQVPPGATDRATVLRTHAPNKLQENQAQRQIARPQNSSAAVGGKENLLLALLRCRE